MSAKKGNTQRTGRSMTPQAPKKPSVAPKKTTIPPRSRGHTDLLPPPMPKPAVAFLGLGAMGRPMAGRLLDLGFPLRVWNRTATTAKTLTGASVGASPGDCVQGAAVIVTMLADADALAAVLDGPDGILAAIAKEKRALRPVIVDMATIGRRAAIALGKRIEASGARFVDAPVSGSVRPAARGELVALVGGAVRSVERARPVLDALCKKVIHAGPIGQGQALKVVLNGVGAHHFVAFASMLALGEKAGLARDILLDAFTTGAFATPSYVGKRDKLLARDFTSEFSLALALKDAALNVQLQHECSLKLPVVRAIIADLESAVSEGLGDLDLFAIEKHYR
ncbi:MAG: NAD(P)-dependent oxidoreductase [Labilithrix sp.]|nr:NAD(P)-dependent oxidoreductase [Labilithrix sp.]MCW5811951.1 NAD(P)-dependent oxidoreductase [Labilithrix sp.]